MRPRKLKVVLCTPIKGRATKDPTPPLGLVYIAGSVRDVCDVTILDNYLSGTDCEGFKEELKKIKPDIVGITCNCEDRFDAFKTANITKESIPQVVCVLGGPFATVCHKEIIEDISSIDLVVRGEGEVTFKEIVDHISKGKSLESILGITYKDKKRIVINDPRPFISNLDDLNPAFELIDATRYPKSTASLIFSRGCPFNCLFCSSKEMWHRTYRIMSPEKCVDQVEYFVDKGIHNFNFWDDHLLLNRKWFYKFADELKRRKLNIRFKCLGRVDSINSDVARTLKELGCYTITLGIENGSQRVLDLMDKNYKVEEAENAVKELFKNNIAATGGSMMNIPGERLEDITTNLKFFKMLEEKYKKPMSLPTNVKIYSGTDLERFAISEGVLKGFRWTSPYQEDRNLLMMSNPYVPLYENIPIEVLLRFISKETLRLRCSGLLINLIWTHILPSDRANSKKGMQKMRRELCINGFIDCLKEQSVSEKIGTFSFVLKETFKRSLNQILKYLYIFPTKLQG